MVITFVPSIDLPECQALRFRTGYGTDGPGPSAMHKEGELLADIDTQFSSTTLTVQFTGFEVSKKLSLIQFKRHFQLASFTKYVTPQVQDFDNS